MECLKFIKMGDNHNPKMSNARYKMKTKYFFEKRASKEIEGGDPQCLPSSISEIGV